MREKIQTKEKIEKKFAVVFDDEREVRVRN